MWVLIFYNQKGQAFLKSVWGTFLRLAKHSCFKYETVESLHRYTLYLQVNSLRRVVKLLDTIRIHYKVSGRGNGKIYTSSKFYWSSADSVKNRESLCMPWSAIIGCWNMSSLDLTVSQFCSTQTVYSNSTINLTDSISSADLYEKHSAHTNVQAYIKI